MKYRNKIEVVADVLVAAREGAKKTHIMYRGNLSFKLVNAYLSVATKAGLISLDNASGHYMATEKGQAFLDRFKKYRRLVSSLERQLGLIKNEMASLEQMCFAGNLPNSTDLNSENTCDGSKVVQGKDSSDSLRRGEVVDEA